MHSCIVVLPNKLHLYAYDYQSILTKPYIVRYSFLSNCFYPALLLNSSQISNVSSRSILKSLTYALSINSIEQDRVKINNNIGTSCEVNIENLGPEDSGIWEFVMVMKDDTGGKVHKYNQEIQINVEYVCVRKIIFESLSFC